MRIRTRETVTWLSVAVGVWTLAILVTGGPPRRRRDLMPPPPNRKPPDALIFRWDEKGESFIFNVVPVEKLEYWRWMGWYLLAYVRDIRQADIEDVRRSDEER
jgi:hypothetical protein